MKKLYDNSNLVKWSLKLAVHLGILEIGSNYETLYGKPRSYRIHPNHLCDPTNIIIKEDCLDKTIANNIRESKLEQRKKKAEKRLDIYNEPVQLYSFYFLDRLRINRDNAMGYWKQWLKENLKAFNPANPIDQDEIQKVYMKYFSSVVAVNRLDDNDKFLVRDKYGRIHSNLTNFPRLLRPFLYFEGLPEPLYQLDLSNSQPLLLVFLFQDYFKEKYKKNLGTSDKMVAYCLKNGFNDVPKYIDLVMDGKLYLELFRIQQNLDEPPDRKLTYDEKDGLKNI
ncbi:MAG: hypothetical protein WCI71_19150, partial [Bacteroidota bacterium]